jgi:formylglycine-generating enzyme required for sulfatase activity
MWKKILGIGAFVTLLIIMFACSRQQEPQEITNSIGMKLRLIPAGSFMMGAAPNDDQAQDEEKPQHRVEITKPFYIGVYEVTQAQYKAVMGESPSRFKGSDNPVEYVSWFDAKAFCRKLSEKEGLAYRLPTEAEWEYACRAGTQTVFFWGDSSEESIVKRYAWYQKNAADELPAGQEGPHPVGRKCPNALSLYDMTGNVYEWCSDRYDEKYYANSTSEDPIGQSTGLLRVMRGGSWLGQPFGLRSSFRDSIAPDHRTGVIGFRVVREMDERKQESGEIQQSRLEAAGGYSVRLQEEITNSIGMKLRLIPAGSFLMGAMPGDDEAGENEEPQHLVKITKPFYIGVYEVTQAQYEALMNDNPSYHKGLSNPVERVAWINAEEFCRVLSATEGVIYRLPTETEWEYAARGGVEGKIYIWGDEKIPLVNGVKQANVADESIKQWAQYSHYKEFYAQYGFFSGYDDGYSETSPVGSYTPNNFGLYDMAGNVSEWCVDFFIEDLYNGMMISPQTGEAGPDYRVCRGGSWRMPVRFARSSSRFFSRPDEAESTFGFRVVREVE